MSCDGGRSDDMKRLTKKRLERLYEQYDNRCCVHPDPVEFLYRFKKKDREVVGFIASALAYGRVQQILRSVADVLARLESPRDTIASADLKELEKLLAGFKHRFTTGNELARLFHGMGRLIHAYGSLGGCMSHHHSPDHTTILEAATAFVDELSDASGGKLPFLLASPRDGSACKRLNLYLRWMVRKDSVDPGGWSDIPRSALVIPLDTHMHRIGLTFGLTTRASGDMKTALEMTAGFRKLCPEDPVRYDFALTRAGILKNWNGPTDEGSTQ